AAALETGYINPEEAKTLLQQMLQQIGRSADDAEQILADAKTLAAGATGSTAGELGNARKFFTAMKSGLLEKWPATMDAAAKKLATDWEKQFLAALKEVNPAATEMVAGAAYDLTAAGLKIDAETLVALSELRKAEHGITVTEEGHQLMV